MTKNIQLEIRNTLSAEEVNQNYLTSKPDALLEKVEDGMLEALVGGVEMNAKDSAILNEAIEYHLRSGGQRLRARLALSAGKAIGLSDHDSVCVAATVELLHNGSLIHDDLQDGGQFRRGDESVWSKFGKNAAICCGDFYLSTAYAVLAGVSNSDVLPQMLKIMHQRVAQASYGQFADLSITRDQLTLEVYLEVVIAKSGALLSLPLELVLLLGGHEKSMQIAYQSCKNFAVGFQIFDDLRDFSTDSLQGVDGRERLNIISVFEQLNHGLDILSDPIETAKKIAVKHLKRSELSFIQLPSQSGHLLEECTKNIISLVKALHC
ncbi:MAG: polyprenyl synthetase family protein [Nitrosospira sp.]|nr:polyprenyl synthetase family protein [Nitrosospira sp.]